MYGFIKGFRFNDLFIMAQLLRGRNSFPNCFLSLFSGPSKSSLRRIIYRKSTQVPSFTTKEQPKQSGPTLRDCSHSPSQLEELKRAVNATLKYSTHLLVAMTSTADTSIQYECCLGIYFCKLL